MTEQVPLGAIVDTNSRGRFDLIIFDDGILGIHGTYVGVALRGAGPGMGGIGAAANFTAALAAGAGAAAGGGAGRRYEDKRILKQLARGRSTLLSENPANHFHAAEQIERLALRKRPWGHSVTIFSSAAPEGRIYKWKPALNRFREVRTLLDTAFPGRVTVE